MPAAGSRPLARRAWTTDQVLRVTGVSRRQLGYWLDKGIVTADVDEARGRGRVRLWSFSNLVEVWVAVWLRDRVSLPIVGEIVSRLRTLEVDGARDEVRVSVHGDLVMEVVVPLAKIERQVRRAAGSVKVERRARRVVPEAAEPVATEVVMGTRVPVATIQGLYYVGWPIKQIIEIYPGLTERDISEALKAKPVR